MILFGSEYAGPAKYFAILSRYLVDDIVCVANSITNNIYIKYGLQYINGLDEIPYDPTLIIFGRCFGLRLDKKLHEWGTNKGIPVVSIIDHWSWYLDGYMIDGIVNLPDHILVNDNLAYDDCVNEGIPADRLFVAGNPVLEELILTGKKKYIDKSKLRSNYSFPEKRLIVFISEDLRDDFHIDKDINSIDEYFVLDEIIKLILPSDHLIIKMHPSEKSDKYDGYLSESVTVVGKMDVHNLNQVADVVIGMGSILLLELAMLRKDVISFCPNTNNRFVGDRLKATIIVKNVQELREILLNPREVSGDFKNKFIGSGRRIAHIIKEMQNIEK
jgi:hypothetical protein